MSSLDRVSIVMIAQNEAERLARLLPELGWADEVVVVDGGSTDATVAVARRHGARVHECPFDNFAAQRNRALELARSPWVFSLDADERPTRGLAAEIRRLVRDGRHAAYRVPIRSRIFGRPFRFSGTQDDRPMRLARRGAVCWVGDVHERLVVEGTVGQARGWLEHETLPDVPAFLAKMRHYTALAVERRIREGRGPRRGAAWLAPAWEIVRRGVLKLGVCDGPAGWLFCLLSGLSAWVEVDELRRRWAVEIPVAGWCPSPATPEQARWRTLPVCEVCL